MNVTGKLEDKVERDIETKRMVNKNETEPLY